MKTFRFFTTVIIAILCMGLVSCNNDEEDEPDNNNIKGAWYSEREEEGLYFAGKGNGYFFDEYGDTEEFTYKLSGTKLTIKENGGTYSVTVKINGNTLEITDESETLTYTKVDINDFL